MKTLMMMAVAALCCAALAEGPEGGRPEGGRPEGGRRGGPREGGMGAMMMDPIVRVVSNPKMVESLGLSEEQQAKLKELRKRSESNREAQKKVREATMKQIELMNAETIDEAAVMKAIDEVFELRKAMAKDQAKRVIAVKSILTPEQIAKAHEEMKKAFAERGKGRGPRGGGFDKGPRGGDRPDGKPAAE